MPDKGTVAHSQAGHSANGSRVSQIIMKRDVCLQGVAMQVYTPELPARPQLP